MLQPRLGKNSTRNKLFFSFSFSVCSGSVLLVLPNRRFLFFLLFFLGMLQPWLGRNGTWNIFFLGLSRYGLAIIKARMSFFLNKFFTILFGIFWECSSPGWEKKVLGKIFYSLFRHVPTQFG